MEETEEPEDAEDVIVPRRTNNRFKDVKDVEEKIRNIFRCPWIKEVRFNAGVVTLMDVLEVISLLKELSAQYGVKIWIDLKGRQLRIIKWSALQADVVELNHKISLDYDPPAYIFFRGALNGRRQTVN